jgi:hypothetical protein
MITANEFRGKAIGATFFTGFGAIWLGLSLYVRELLSTSTITLLVVGTLSLLLGCLWTYRQADLWPEVAEDPAMGRTFGRVNAAQWIAGAVVAFSFSRLHLDAYIPSAITAIVGIHLFPLAKLFRRKLHLVTGVVMVLWASVTVLAVPVEQLQGITALGTGIILWASAAISLSTGIAAARSRNAAVASNPTLTA